MAAQVVQAHYLRLSTPVTLLACVKAKRKVLNYSHKSINAVKAVETNEREREK